MKKNSNFASRCLQQQGLSEAYVSISRIQKYLEYPELPNPEKVSSTDLDNSNIAISIQDMTCHWNHVKEIVQKDDDDENDDDDDSQKSLSAALSNVSIDFKKGELTCIIGTVGCGKSAILQAVVGELPVFSGTLRRSYDKLAYASQDPVSFFFFFLLL